MRVLVTAASKHGATTDIAARIAEVLTARGVEVSNLAPDMVDAVDEYDAVVLGSGVYAGRWLEPAKRFIERNREQLADRPVWLFSSGPIGDPLAPDGDPADAAAMILATGARGHRVFGGRLDRADLSLPEKLIVKVVRAPDGDYRAWHDIQVWADEIATELAAPPVGAPT